MAETVWYYARGDVERGPFTSVQIKALANAGKLRGDDLVWREGMENWTPAADVPELFAERPAAEKPGQNPFGYDSPATARIPAAERLTREVQNLAAFSGRGFLLVGLLSVVLVRGCESLGERRIAQVQAATERVAVEEPREAQPNGDNGLSYSNDPVRPVRSPAVARAQAEFQSGAYYRGLALFVGALFTFLGAAILATITHGPDRWLGIAIVVVICLTSLRLQ